MKIDRRNRYRAVHNPNRGYWRVEFKPWYWPFWIFCDAAYDFERAVEKANAHAAPRRREVVHIGRLPAPARKEQA